MNSIIIDSAGARVRLQGDEGRISEMTGCEFLYSYIPSAQVLEDRGEEVDATISVFCAKKGQISLDFPQISIYGGDVKDLITLAEYVLERARQEKGIVCIHGAGAVVDGRVVVCWGPATGMGKTTLALRLSEDGNQFYSDEKILIDLKKGRAVGRIKNQYVSNDFWRNKRGDRPFFTPENLSQEDEYDIAYFVYPLICEGKEITVDTWSDDKFFWHLQEESCRKIRGTSRLFFNFTQPVDSLDTPALALQRTALVRAFTHKFHSMYYKGRADSFRPSGTAGDR